jgi:hypothetical protein
MSSLRWLLPLLFLLPAMGHAQRQAAKERNWVFHAGAWLLWNTVHGDRYAAFGPPPIALPLRDRDFSHTRSLARNSLSPAIGGMVERRIYKSLWMAAGLEFVGRPQKYVFDPDTLAAYPPIAPPPFGLYFKQVIHYWYGLELPVMVEMKTGDWLIGAGVSVYKNIHSKGVAIRLDGSSYVLYDTPARNSPLLSTAIPKVMFGYDGIGEEKRLRFMLGADVRKKVYGANRRWVDVRFGASVRIGG